MAEILKAACIQLNSGPDIKANIEAAAVLIRQAAKAGATLIATPEVTDQVISGRADKIGETHTEETHPGIPFFAALAGELKVHLLIGSMIVRIAEGKVANRSFLFGPEGVLKARYDKIHLYDVDLPTGESHRESRIFAPGVKAPVVDIGDVKLGMTICYDLRFPHLARSLAREGAGVIAIPAAFTVPTGKAHWETLLKARAIETGSFILAPAQSGDHAGARKTYGHSMILAPWGEILAERAEEGPGFITADLALQRISEARSAIPALQHDREFDVISL
jgi:predicted amidohydrolase